MKKSLILLALGALATVAQAETIVIKGSDTLGAKMVPQLAEAYKASGKDANFEIAAEGSSTAFSALKAGEAQIGMSSRDVKDSEKAELPGLKEHIAGIDMIGVIVNKANGVEGYKTFQKLGMGGRDYGSNTQKMAGNEQIAQEVGKNANGVGYVGLAYTEANGVKPVTVEGIAATPENATKYDLARNLYYYTVGMPEGEAGEFLKWATSDPAAASIVEKVGFISYANKKSLIKKLLGK